MTDHAFALAAAFEASGLRAEVLPEPDKESLNVGKNSPLVVSVIQRF